MASIIGNMMTIDSRDNGKTLFTGVLDSFNSIGLLWNDQGIAPAGKLSFGTDGQLVGEIDLSAHGPQRRLSCPEALAFLHIKVDDIPEGGGLTLYFRQGGFGKDEVQPGPGAFRLDPAMRTALAGKKYPRAVGNFTWLGKTYITASCDIGGLLIYEQSSDGGLALIQEVPGGADVAHFHGAPVAVGNKLFCPAREEGLLVFDLNRLGTASFTEEDNENRKSILPPDGSLTTGYVPKTTGVFYDQSLDVLFIFQRTGGWNAISGVSVTDMANLAVSPTLHKYTTADLNLETHRGHTIGVGGKRILLAPSLTTNILLACDVSDGSTAPIESYFRRNVNSFGCWDATRLGDGLALASQWGYPNDHKRNFGIGIYDYNDPQRPRLCGRIADPRIPFYGQNKDSAPYDVYAKDGMVYVAGGETGIWVVNYNNPYAPFKTALGAIVEPPSINFGYTGVTAANGYVYALGGDILNPADNVRLDVFQIKGTPQGGPARLYRGFLQQGQEAPYYLDEFFDEDFSFNPDKLLDGTRNFLTVDWEHAKTPPVLFGDRQTKFAMGVYKKQTETGEYKDVGETFRLTCPNKNMQAFSFAFKGQICGTTPTYGKNIIMDITKMVDTSVTGDKNLAEDEIYNKGTTQVFISPQTNGTLRLTLRVYHGNTFTDIYYSSAVPNDGVFDVQGKVDLGNRKIYLNVNGEGWRNKDIAGAVVIPTVFCLGCRRTDTIDPQAYELALLDRYVIAEGLQDINLTRGNIWELPFASVPSVPLKWEQEAAVQKNSLAELGQDGDWFYDTASSKLYLYSSIDPNTAHWGLYAE